jgi:hydroxymethylpyrimidine pyrophosphatase-like HAD family hydrolase
MRYLAIATAYDGTLTKTGRMAADVIGALERLRESGRRAILVTRRPLHDIAWACPRLDLFDYVVADSGAVLHRPAAWETIALSGRRGAPSASALERALREMRVESERLVAIGTQAGDDEFLAVSGFPVATADATDLVKRRARVVTRASSGDGVIELVDEIVRDALAVDRRPVVAVGSRPVSLTNGSPAVGNHRASSATGTRVAPDLRRPEPCGPRPTTRTRGGQIAP